MTYLTSHLNGFVSLATVFELKSSSSTAMRAPNRSDCYVAILVSGLLRYANESFQENLPHLQQLNPHCTFHVFVSTSSMSTFGSEDIKHARRFISNGTASNGTASNGMQESQLPPEKSRAPTTVMIEQIYGSNLKDARLAAGPMETSKGMLATSQSARERIMRWRMQDAWHLMEPHMERYRYKYVLWMRPDALVRLTVPFDQVDIGEDVHMLVCFPLRDHACSWWGTPKAMGWLLKDGKVAALRNKCECDPQPTGIPKPPDVRKFGFGDHLFDNTAACRAPPGDISMVYCALLQHMWASSPNRTFYLVGYGAAVMNGRPPCLHSRCAHEPASSLFGFNQTVGPWSKCSTRPHTDAAVAADNAQASQERRTKRPQCTVRKPFWGPFSPPYGQGVVNNRGYPSYETPLEMIT